MRSSIPTYFSAKSLPRVPLVPDEVLRRHNVFFEIDTRFRRAARLLQCLWLTDSGISTGVHIRGVGNTAVETELGSCLSPDAAEAGRNFLSPAIHSLVRHELIMREEGAAIDEDRLFGNALSSMPLCFNMFGPLALDLELATSVFRRLLPEFVHTVEQITFEHSPGRRELRFLADGTAFDLAVRVTTPEGESATVYVEVKYSEGMTGPAARMRDRYGEAARAVHLYTDVDSQLLRSLALEQLWREHMLAQLAVDQGVTSRAVFMAVGPRLNRRVMAAFRCYQSELIDQEHQDTNRVAFEPLTIEAFIDAINAAGAADLAQALWSRYCDFERIFLLSLQEIGCFTATDRTAKSPVAHVTPPMSNRNRRPLTTRSSRRQSKAQLGNPSSTGKREAAR